MAPGLANYEGEFFLGAVCSTEIGAACSDLWLWRCRLPAECDQLCALLFEAEGFQVAALRGASSFLPSTSIASLKFDNVYRCRHSVPDGLMRATDVCSTTSMGAATPCQLALCALPMMIGGKRVLSAAMAMQARVPPCDAINVNDCVTNLSSTMSIFLACLCLM